MIKKLSSMPYAQAQVIKYDDGTVVLQSYSTYVATLSNDKWLTVHGLYSMTTRRHISAFMREYCNLSYHHAKSCYMSNYQLNVDTGEIRPL